jgi:putative transposase
LVSIRRQCALLQINRSSYYYQPKPKLGKDDIHLMEEIDKIYTRLPYYGVTKITKQLKRQGIMINHKKVYRLMKVMGIQAIYPKEKIKGLSQSEPGHAIYPYLLNGITAGFPNHIWGVDITYIRLKNDWLYLFAVLDWHSRFVLSWELSDSLTTDFCCFALKQALADFGIPEIYNSDQGSQLTAKVYLNILRQHPEIKISMDHKGRCFDNIFTERIWRTIKYEEVYVKDYQNYKEAKQSLTDYLNIYNYERLHENLNYQTPAEIYFRKH